MLKPSDNPPIHPPQIDSIAELSGQWWLAHTKARFEKAFAWDLCRRNIGYFLPLVEKKRFSGGRKRSVMLPLFSSYVFFCADDKGRYAAMATNRLCRIIPVEDQEKLVAELMTIEKVMADNVSLELFPHIAVGRRCRIDAGPLKGVEGVVVRCSKSSRIVLNVSILGQGASVEVDAGLLEQVD